MFVIMIYLNPVLILMQSTGNHYLQIQLPELPNAINITKNQNDNDFIKAKYDEIEKLKHFNAYKDVPDSRQTCISTRVLTAKKIK